MYTAAIAYRNLTQSAKDKADSLVAYFAKEYSNSPDFIQAACWADDVKEERLNLMSDWHFTNNPVVKDVVTGQVPASANDKNVVWALNGINETLQYRGPEAHAFSKAFAMRLLIHFAGDIHQPLHTVTMFSDAQFPPPVGDQGGNLFKIAGANQSELHAFWDSGCGLWEVDRDRPLNTSAYDQVYALVDDIVRDYPPSFFGDRLNTSDSFADWATDSYSIGVNNVYTLTPGSALSSQYVATSREIARQQVALGGYRLASFLNDVFGS
mmetsp:Transcript_18190/g.58108  ORF Transcript_18190/g.58108 Transcript_18190/m.58108 type:complete len:267 (+) Transcript_18190:36-836(+)